MSKDINKVEDDIRNLCIEMICLLDKLKQKGLIDDEEYQRHIREKKKFLNSIYK